MSARRPSSSRSARRTSNSLSLGDSLRRSPSTEIAFAVRDRELALTYGELDAWANGIASETLAHGDRDSTPVALLLPQSAASVAAIIGALKSASPYVSLDPSDPRGVRAHRARRRQGGAHGCKSAPPVARAVSGERQVIVVDETEHRAIPESEPLPKMSRTSSSRQDRRESRRASTTLIGMCCTTSCATRTRCESPPADRLSLVQSPAFSGTVSTLFSALLNGASVFPVPPARARDSRSRAAGSRPAQ